eukprot:2122622-Amphidinium_carterae.1
MQSKGKPASSICAPVIPSCFGYMNTVLAEYAHAEWPIRWGAMQRIKMGHMNARICGDIEWQGATIGGVKSSQ